MTKLHLFLSIALSSLAACSGDGGGSSDPGPLPVSTPTPPLGPVSTVEEIIAEPRTGGAGGEPTCGGEFGFRRCVCADQVPSSVRYRPAVAECNGNAAAILYDEFSDAFSVVVRDTQNRDRFPPAGSGFGGCSAELADSEAPPNRCSAFKVQMWFPIEGNGIVNCFGESGYSETFSDAARLTIKLSDIRNSDDDPLARFCLVAGDLPLN